MRDRSHSFNLEAVVLRHADATKTPGGPQEKGFSKALTKRRKL